MPRFVSAIVRVGRYKGRCNKICMYVPLLVYIYIYMSMYMRMYAASEQTSPSHPLHNRPHPLSPTRPRKH